MSDFMRRLQTFNAWTERLLDENGGGGECKVRGVWRATAPVTWLASSGFTASLVLPHPAVRCELCSDELAACGVDDVRVHRNGPCQRKQLASMETATPTGVASMETTTLTTTTLGESGGCGAKTNQIGQSAVAAQRRDVLTSVSRDAPRHPLWSTARHRELSFDQADPAPVYPAGITYSSLAAAGFFYQGFGDSVRCFQCDLGLKNFVLDDDPLMEHAKYNAACVFVQRALNA